MKREVFMNNLFRNRWLVLSMISSFIIIMTFSMISCGGGGGKPPAMTRCVGNPPPEGCYTTIQSAIDASNAGDTIIVHAADYQENIVVDRKIELKTAGDGDVTIQAQDAYQDVITIERNGSSSIISGFNIFGGDDGITLNRAEDCVISGNIVEHHLDNGIVLSQSHHNEITNNTVSGVGEGQIVGILLDRSNSNTITMNEVPYNKLNGIALNASSGNQVIGNSISFTDGDGIGLSLSNDNSIDDNSITNSNFTGIVIERSSRNSIIGNKISDNEGQASIGIILVGSIGNESNNNLIENNQVERMSAFGIVLIYARDNEIIRNRIANALMDGIVMDNDTLNTKITENTITENDVGIHVYEGAVGNTTHNNNILSNNSWGVLNDSTVQFDATLNYWGPEGPAGQTSGDVIVDPWLTNPVQ
jgi:parallel beta-helix repeat protein